ncbi:MAG TPA: lipoyl synthase [Feifaniaceae bacterium]|nr:lipoyl synthase [Feifaniaceae bacterium]
MEQGTEQTPLKKPDWLRVRSGAGEENRKVVAMLRKLSLHTVCEEANCPNCGECFHKRTATFMILGNNCTRNCTFCTVTKGRPAPVDPQEPGHVAAAVKELGLKHVVVTSVTRDDLFDGGASHFADVIRAIKGAFSEDPPVIEVLIPDFQGDEAALLAVIAAKPHIINHNVETVPRLYPEVRPMAAYGRSLELLARVKREAPEIYIKSGVMVGLGEAHEEVAAVMKDLRKIGCDILTVGQYLAPSKLHHPVVAYIAPEEFAAYKREAEALGFLYAASAPLVRSSYMAGEAFEAIRKGANRA